MKTSIRSLALFLTAASVAYPAPFLAVGDGAELFLTGTVGIRSDDNIFLSSTKVDDVIIDINPGFELVFGKGSITEGHLSFTESFARYSENDAQDTELAALNFSSNYDDGKTTVATKAGYNELVQNTADLVGLTPRDITTLGIDAELSASAKSKVGIGAQYSNTDYGRTGYNDLTTFTIPLDYYYAVTSKVDLSLGVRYRTTEVTGGIDSKGYAYRVGARGEFSPKVTGTIKVGFSTRELDTGPSEDLLDIDAKLNIELSPKSTLQLTASNDFGVSAQGAEQKNLAFGGTLIGKVSDQLSFRGALNFRAIDYYSRTDDYVEAQLGLDYVVSTAVTVRAGYAYRNNESDLAGGDFDNSVFSLAARFRY